MNKHTYCCRYYDIDRNTCYIWIEAPSLEVAKRTLYEENRDVFKLIDIQETFNWQ